MSGKRQIRGVRLGDGVTPEAANEAKRLSVCRSCGGQVELTRICRTHGRRRADGSRRHFWSGRCQVCHEPYTRVGWLPR
jgi:hypothetical protein